MCPLETKKTSWEYGLSVGHPLHLQMEPNKYLEGDDLDARTRNQRVVPLGQVGGWTEEQANDN
jgi:hypothetical protein